MNLENQVCSLEQSKKLKNLGIVQDANFFWGKDLSKSKTKMVLYSKDDIIHNMAIIDKYVIPKLNLKYWIKEKKFIAAYTVAELGVMLPEYYPSWRFNPKQANGSKNGTSWISTVITKDKVKDGHTVTTRNEFDRYGLTEAKSRATLLISLLEVGVVKASEVNKRLVKK